MSNPFFSIVIPVFNREKFIIKTVVSVLAQDFKNFELIIVNDGSYDNTEDVILSAFENDKRVKYFKIKNCERGAARNYGIDLCKGEYVVFLDSDDEWLTDYLSTLMFYVKAKNKPDIIAAKYFLKNYISKKSTMHKGLKELPSGFYDFSFFLVGNHLSCNFSIKKDAIKFKFLCDRSYATMEDWIFLIQNSNERQLFLIDEWKIIMNDHDGRSMNSSQVIKKRLKATEYIKKNILLNSKQTRYLNSNTYLFCSIHAMLAHSWGNSYHFLFRAFRENGFMKNIVRQFFRIKMEIVISMVSSN